MATKTATSSKKHTTTTVHSNNASSINGVASLAKENQKAISAVVAEFIGTFVLVASILSVQNSPLYVVFAFLGVTLMVGGISGAHLNPAMTIGAFITKKIGALRGTFYIVAQLLGAGAAWLVLSAFIGGVDKSSAMASSATLFHAGKIAAGKEWYFLFAELLGAFILAIGVSTAVKIKRDRVQASLTASFSFFAALLIAISVTSLLITDATSSSTFSLSFINPATALAANALTSFWSIAIYVFAPIVGGVLGFLLQDILLPKAVESKN